MRKIAALAMICALSSCAKAPELPPEPVEPPAMRWDFHPEGDEWTEATFDALNAHGAPLLSFVPTDIDTYCPAYPEADRDGRAAFWTGLFSALAKHESTWNPRAVGGGGLWFGLTQIDPRSADWFGCKVTSGEALKDGPANLSCAVRIATRQVLRRGTVTRGMRDWGPFHSSGKRADMAAWTRDQDYCSAG